MKASNSRIQCYKSCRRMYQLKYLYGLQPVKQSDAIERGLSYHDMIEDLLKTGEVHLSGELKVDAMATAFARYIFPSIDAVAQEEWFEYQTKSGNTVIGRIDARAKDGTLIEHKTVGSEITEEYWYNLENNEQVLTYMAAYGVERMIYTVCRTPNIRIKKNETEEEFFQRCKDWFEEDTDTKIQMREIYRTKEDIEEFKEEQDATINEMSTVSLFYRNESHCMKWGKMCEYAPVCRHYDPNLEYVGFIREEKEN